jgi:dolichyl-phosphate beta-glucosyltransferase
VIPAYNEGQRIESTLGKLIEYLANNFTRFEIIVIDDGSGDDTAAKVKRVAETNPHIALISYFPNRGKGFAVRQGMLRAANDAVLFTDADLSTPVEEIEIALGELARGFPVVIASRRHPDSTIACRQSRAREIIGRIFNALVRLMIGLPHKDTQCGFKCFTRSAAKKVFGRARIDTFSFDVECCSLPRRLDMRSKKSPSAGRMRPAAKCARCATR